MIFDIIMCLLPTLFTSISHGVLWVPLMSISTFLFLRNYMLCIGNFIHHINFIALNLKSSLATGVLTTQGRTGVHMFHKSVVFVENIIINYSN